MKKSAILLCGVIMLFVPLVVLAKIGVGIGTGRITIEQEMKPGLIYSLPPVMVMNTGDEPSEYGVGIQWHENQPELRPEAEWFSFSPATFHLEPGTSQIVQTKLTLPIKGVKPGKYFAFLQGFPVRKATGGASVGIAAATKLYFSVAPANFLTGIYYRVTSFFTIYSPWSYIVLIVVLGSGLIALLRRFISFNIGVSVRKK